MINMAVLNLKDIIKYLIKITIVIAIVIGLTRYFSNAKENITKQIQIIENVPLLSCLDTTIPGIANMKQEQVKEKTSPLKTMLDMQLGMLSSFESKEVVSKVNSKEENTISENITSEDTTNKNQTEEPLKEAETGLKTEVQSSKVKETYNSEYNGVKIKNETDYKLTTKILTPNVTVKKDNILIFHTHTCESYTSSEKYKYKATGNYRTTDKNYSVVRVGRELDRQLQNYGYNVIHNETYHDYPSYTGSYSNSYNTVTKLLQQNKNTDVVIDLHRDAVRR